MGPGRLRSKRTIDACPNCPLLFMFAPCPTRSNGTFQGIKSLRPETPYLVNPCRELVQSVWIQLVDSPLRIAPHADEIGSSEFLQMLRNCGRTGLESTGNLARAERSRGKQLDDSPTSRVGENTHDLHFSNYVFLT